MKSSLLCRYIFANFETKCVNMLHKKVYTIFVILGAHFLSRVSTSLIFIYSNPLSNVVSDWFAFIWPSISTVQNCIIKVSNTKR